MVLLVDGVTTSGNTSEVWRNSVSGFDSGDAEIMYEATDRIRSLGVALLVRDDFSYTLPTAEWFGELRYLVIYSERDRGLVAPDLDLDGDVDQDDFGAFQACFSGPGISQEAAECLPARFDTDEDVDQDDFTVFEGCVSGANTPADPECAV
jgi:hypothetical protein